MKSYRVRRHLVGDSSIVVRSTTLPECQAYLESVQRKWNDLKDMGTFGGKEPYETSIKKNKELVVTQGETIVDHYVVEKA